MKYDLPALAKSAGLKRNVFLRPIEATQTLKQALYVIVAASVREWSKQVQEKILPAYAGAKVAAMTVDTLEEEELADIIRLAELAAEGALTQTLQTELPQWLNTALRWHNNRWTASVRAGSGIDVRPYIDQTQSLPKVLAFQARAASLITSVSEQARRDVSEIVWRGVTEGLSRREVSAQIQERLGMARARANRIANDQSQKLTSELTRVRQQEAGITRYKWRHSGKRNPRQHHLARDGKVYKQGYPRGDLPGYAPFCGCVSEPYIEVEEEVAENAEPTPTPERRPEQRRQILAGRRRRADEAAAKKTLDHGFATGNEYLVAIDRRTARVIDEAGGTHNAVSFSDRMSEAMEQQGASIVWHHNHPSSSSFSSADLRVAGLPQSHSIWAHGHNGSSYYARVPNPISVSDYTDAVQRGHNALREAYRAGRVNEADALKISNHVVMLALEKRGLMTYTTRLNAEYAAIVRRADLDIEG